MNTIKLDKEISELDKFVLNFVNIDIFIPKISKEKLALLYDNLIEKGYWCLNSSELISLKEPLLVKINNSEMRISYIELQIAFKEEVLKSNKDLEDAKHLRLVAKGHLNETLINEYKKELRRR